MRYRSVAVGAAPINYYEKRKPLSGEHPKLARLAQARRNALHAFKDAELGTHAEFLVAVRGYRSLLRDVSRRLRALADG